jgi:hypothetical protein
MMCVHAPPPPTCLSHNLFVLPQALSTSHATSMPPLPFLLSSPINDLPSLLAPLFSPAFPSKSPPFYPIISLKNQTVTQEPRQLMLPMLTTLIIVVLVFHSVTCDTSPDKASVGLSGLDRDGLYLQDKFTLFCMSLLCSLSVLDLPPSRPNLHSLKTLDSAQYCPTVNPVPIGAPPSLPYLLGSRGPKGATCTGWSSGSNMECRNCIPRGYFSIKGGDISL